MIESLRTTEHALGIHMSDMETAFQKNEIRFRVIPRKTRPPNPGRFICCIMRYRDETLCAIDDEMVAFESVPVCRFSRPNLSER